jgi:molecular chaperone GrpE (heat shock protein)
MPSVIIENDGRQTRWTYMDSTGPSQPDLLPESLERESGVDGTASQVVHDGSFDTTGEGVTNQPPEELDAAVCLDHLAPVLEQGVPLLDDGPSAVDELANLTASFQDLAAQADRSHDRAQALEDIIARMQERITELQGDQVRALYGPVIHELAALHADVVDAAQHDFTAAPREKITAELTFIADRIEGSLTLLGLESVAAAEGVAFDARKHLAGHVVPTDDEALDRTIAAVCRQGYAFPGAPRTALFALVDVYRYDSELLPVLAVPETHDARQSSNVPDPVEAPGSSQVPTTSERPPTTSSEGVFS